MYISPLRLYWREQRYRRWTGRTLWRIHCHRFSSCVIGPIARLKSLVLDELQGDILFPRTIKVGGSDEGDVDTKISMVGGAIEA